jgi:hypothetical protein
MGSSLGFSQLILLQLLFQFFHRFVEGRIDFAGLRVKRLSWFIWELRKFPFVVELPNWIVLAHSIQIQPSLLPNRISRWPAAGLRVVPPVSVVSYTRDVPARSGRPQPIS